jgi:hypothetical protein
LKHALVFLYGCSVPAAFLAEHSPGLKVRDGVFDGGADFAQRGVELGLSSVEVATRESFERDDLDALDTDVTQVGRSWQVGEHSGEAGGGEGVGVVAGAVDRDWAYGGQTPSQCGGDLDVHRGISGLG